MGVDIDQPAYTVAISKSAHTDLTNIENRCISNFVKNNGKVTVHNIHLMEIELAKVDDAYRDWFIENGANSNRIKLVFKNSLTKFNRFALGHAQRLKQLGLFAGSIGIFSLLTTNVEAGKAIADGDVDTQAALDTFMSVYETCLSEAEMGDISSHRADVLIEAFCNYSRAIKIDDRVVGVAGAAMGALVDTNNVPGVRPR